MRLQSKLIGLLSLVLCSLTAWEVSAQSGNTQSPANGGDRNYQIDTGLSARSMREDDKVFRLSVWRRIDRREKYNLPFYGSGDTKTDGTIGNIYKAVVEENALEICAHEDFRQPMPSSEFQNNFC